MLPEDELREMAESIRVHGQFVPCVMGPDGVGRDGRNRVASCALVGVEPRWEVHNGDPVTFIVEVNAERRHLTTGQRAMAVAIGLVEADKRKGGKFVRGSVPDRPGPGTKAWRNTLAQAGVVLDHAPELVDAVLSGDTALDAAHRQADERHKARKRIKALGGELAALVDTGVIDVIEAERRADEDRRLEKMEDDLAERVRDGSLALDEAETISREREARLAVWIENVQDALALLVPMADGTIPSRFRHELPKDDYDALAVMLGALKRRKKRQDGKREAA